MRFFNVQGTPKVSEGHFYNHSNVSDIFRKTFSNTSEDCRGKVLGVLAAPRIHLILSARA